MVTDPQLLELRQMTAELLGGVRALAPLSERVDRALEAHVEIRLALGALQVRLDAIEKHETRIEKAEGRLKSLEEDRIRVKAWAALIGLFVSVGAFIAGKFWK